jgi:GNAT superfamily N-acetyltransferase
MHTCSIHKTLAIVPGSLADYRELATYHYRDERPGPVQAVFALKVRDALGRQGKKAVGVIVYTMPNPRVELRRVATGRVFAGLDRQTELSLINRNVRCISRVVIEPRYRGIGLAARLVRETMPLMNVPVVEALGVMPLANPFLEKAGMKSFEPRVARSHVELAEALSTVGIEEDALVQPQAVQQKLDALPDRAADFIEARVRQFLKSHGRRRDMPPGLQRTRYILGKLTHRPAYYIWFHPNLEVTLP